MLLYIFFLWPIWSKSSMNNHVLHTHWSFRLMKTLSSPYWNLKALRLMYCTWHSNYHASGLSDIFFMITSIIFMQNCTGALNKRQIIWQSSTIACHTVLLTEGYGGWSADCWSHRGVIWCSGDEFNSTHPRDLDQGTSRGLEACCGCSACKRWNILLPDLACRKSIWYG